MTTTYGNLTAYVRDRSGKGIARRIRRQGLVPGVLYGRGKDAVPIYLDPRTLFQAMDPARLLNTLFHLRLARSDSDEALAEETCIITDRQTDPLRDTLTHVDFLRVDLDSPVERVIPVRCTGRAAGVMAGGVLKLRSREVRILARPGEVPSELTVDVTALEAGQMLRVRDVTLPGVRFLTRENEILVSVAIPKAESEAPAGGPGEAASTPTPGAAATEPAAAK